MKPVINCLVLLFFSHQLRAQLDSAECQFVHNIIRHYQRTGTIYYSDHFMDGLLKRDLKGLSKRVVLDIRRGKDSIILSSKERRFLLRQMKTQAAELSDSLFPNSKRITGDSIVKFVGRKNRSIYDSLLISGDSVAAYRFLGSNSIHCSFFFTSPIYIRNRSVMLFHFMWFMSSSGGSHSLSFYRKENNKWEEWIFVSGGDW